MLSKNLHPGFARTNLFLLLWLLAGCGSDPGFIVAGETSGVARSILRNNQQEVARLIESGQYRDALNIAQAELYHGILSVDAATFNPNPTRHAHVNYSIKNVVNILIRMGSLTEASRLLEAPFSRNQLSTPHLRAVILLAGGRISEAERLLSERISDDPSFTSQEWRVGEPLLRSGTSFVSTGDLWLGIMRHTGNRAAVADAERFKALMGSVVAPNCPGTPPSAAIQCIANFHANVLRRLEEAGLSRFAGLQREAAAGAQGSAMNARNDERSNALVDQQNAREQAEATRVLMGAVGGAVAGLSNRRSQTGNQINIPQRAVSSLAPGQGRSASCQALDAEMTRNFSQVQAQIQAQGQSCQGYQAFVNWWPAWRPQALACGADREVAAIDQTVQSYRNFIADTCGQR